MKQVLIALDQLINTFFFGWADETISARSYRNQNKYNWYLAYRLINIIFFWKKDHCYDAYISERFRRQLPIEYRI